MLLERFVEKLGADQLSWLIKESLDCEANRINHKVTTHEGKKYIKVNIGGSGRYMVVIETGEIFGIKAYGVIHRGHKFGTLETVGDWYWGGYRGVKI